MPKLRRVSEPDAEGRFEVEDEQGNRRKVREKAKALAAPAAPEPKKPEPEGAPAKASAPAEAAKFFQYELEAGLVTLNELRASKGLPRDERFGEMTMPEYIAANAATYKAMTFARSTSEPVGPAADPAVGDEVPE